MGKTETVVRECTSISLIDLCEAGRYRLAESVVADGIQGLLGLGMVEIAKGNLEAAKDYLSRLAFSDESLADRAKVQLAVAYWFGGEATEAKDLVNSVPDSFEKFLLKAIIESRPKYALRFLKKCEGYSVRPGMAGRMHNQRAIILRKLGQLDEAIQEYEAALYFFEQDQSDCVTIVLNNLAGVYLDFGEIEQAQSYVDKAISLIGDDLPHLGKFLDQKSQIFLAQNDYSAARKQSESAISVLRKTDRKEWLIEALLTYAKALRAQHDERELQVLEQAADVCQFLQRDDLLIDVLKRRLELAQQISIEAEKLLVQTALSAGSYRAAAVRLQTTHPRVMRLVKKFGLEKHLTEQ
jgi:tetratricopeptide (TPR) repeat protein